MVIRNLVLTLAWSLDRTSGQRVSLRAWREAAFPSRIPPRGCSIAALDSVAVKLDQFFGFGGELKLCAERLAFHGATG